MTERQLTVLLKYIGTQKEWYPKGIKTTTLYTFPQMIAAARGTATVVPPGYRTIIGVVNDSYMTVAYNTPDFKNLGYLILKVAKNKTNFLKYFQNNFLKKSDSLRKFAEKIHYLKEVHNIGYLKEVLTLLYKKTLAVQSMGYITEIFTTTNNLWFTKFLQECGINFETTIQQLTHPLGNTFLQKAATEIKKSKSNTELLLLVKKYYWILGSYWNLPNLGVKDIKSLGYKYKTQSNQEIIKFRKEILKLSKQPSQLRLFFKLLDTFAVIQDERKVNVLFTNYALLKIARETKKFFPNLSQREITELTVDELIKLCENTLSISKIKKLVKKRAKKATWVFSPKGYIISTNYTLYKKVYRLLNSPKTNGLNLQGTPTSGGKVTGKVRIILSEQDFKKFQNGEVLVTSMTRPEFLPIMKKARAFITNEGGITSHAAIIAREMNKPCIIGTKIATKVFKDGDVVEVDANKGIIRKIK